MNHVKVDIQKVLTWGIRLVSAYLFFWWAILYLGYASLELLGIKDIFAAIFLGIIHSFSHFISTINYQRRIQHIIVGLFIIFGFVNYLYLSTDKVHYIDFLGVTFHILAMIYFLKLNFRGGTKWLTS